MHTRHSLYLDQAVELLFRHKSLQLCDTLLQSRILRNQVLIYLG